MDWNAVAERALNGEGMSREEALAAARPGTGDLLDLVHAASRIRFRHHGRRVRVNILLNARSGACPEDCAFCSQSARARAEAPRYPLKSVEEIVGGARRAAERGASTFCVVTSLPRPSAGDVEAICEATRRIKARWPRLAVCASLGLLTPEEARILADAGLDRYNHNLETSRRFFPRIVTTHTFDDRVATVRAAREAGLQACSGGIVGLGESAEDRADLALMLRELEVESIPVNFLDPRPGTPLESRNRPSPVECVRALALFRLANPQAIDVRAAGGREACLESLQPLALFAANSLFGDGYLTTGGQGLERDLRMIREAGFTPEVFEE